MNQLKTTSKLYNFNAKNPSLADNIVEEIRQAAESGNEYFVIGDISERTSGFVRGSLMSNLVVSLQELTNNAKDGIRIAIKNTYEDLDFYSYVLNKVPGVYFQFDEEYAVKYSKNSLDEWNEFLNRTNAI
jgi:hypothetical protein